MIVHVEAERKYVNKGGPTLEEGRNRRKTRKKRTGWDKGILTVFADL